MCDAIVRHCRSVVLATVLVMLAAQHGSVYFIVRGGQIWAVVSAFPSSRCAGLCRARDCTKLERRVPVPGVRV